MGQKSAGATLARIYEAFLARRTWSQAELARRVGVGVPALRRRLQDLIDAGVPLRDEAEHPHVYWKLPRDWFPGGLLVRAESVGNLLRLLLRLPTSASRDRLLDELVRAARPHDSPDGSVLDPPSLTAIEETYLDTVEDAARAGVPIRMRYYTASRGALEDRHVSVAKVRPGPPARFAAVCHRERRLKWFRLDNVHSAHPDPAERFRKPDPEALTAFLAASLDGFHQGDPPRIHRFFVRQPESRWVRQNLPGPMAAEDTGTGLHVSAETSAPLRLARFVVGLGEAARAETPELAALVRELAEGALGARQIVRVGQQHSPSNNRRQARHGGRK